MATATFLHSFRRKRYDLPLHRGNGGRLVTWIVGVMSYLTILMLVLVFALGAVQNHWEASLTGQMTVEIPADHAARASDAFGAPIIDELVRKLDALPDIHARVLPLEEMEKLVGPWLGTGEVLRELPLPVLVDITLDGALDNNRTKERVALITETIRSLVPEARLDTHQEWLADLTRLAKACRMVLVAISIILALTAAVTVAATARTRLALHKDEVALLHLIGATDSYIATQFQRQAFRLATEGAAAGLLLAVITMAIVGFIKNQLGDTVVPVIRMGALEWLCLLLTPLFAGVIAMLASRFTVLHALKRMP